MWCYTDMSHCEWAVCGYEGFLVLVSLLCVGLVRFFISLKYISVAAGIRNTKSDIYLVFLIHTELRCAVNHTACISYLLFRMSFVYQLVYVTRNC
jgi:hypothetical protein